MRLTVTSPKAFILQSLEDQVLALRRKQKQGISPTFEFGLAELARLEMRSLARQANGGCGEEELLEQSIQQACDALQARVEQRDLRFDVEPYLPGLRNTLQFPAKEIAELCQNRIKVEQHGQVTRIPNPRIQAAIPYEIFEAGQWQVASGLMARPLVDEFDIELVHGSEEYQFEGEWFPFIVTRKETQFIVNENGEIFVMIAKISGEYTLTIMSRLFKVCELIYREPQVSEPGKA